MEGWLGEAVGLPPGLLGQGHWARLVSLPGEAGIPLLNRGQAPARRKDSHRYLPLPVSPKMRIWESPGTLRKGSFKSPYSHTHPFPLRSLIHEPQTSCLYTQPMGPSWSRPLWGQAASEPLSVWGLLE